MEPHSRGSETLLSPAELSFLHTSLSLEPPVRPDLRTPTQFRPLIAETDFIPATNGSARVCFSDGTEAIVGVKAELEKSVEYGASKLGISLRGLSNVDNEDEQLSDRQNMTSLRAGWLEVSLDIPGYRDDDNLPVFLSSMVAETLLASKALLGRLAINARWHWKLYIDILMLSPPLSYPLPLISLAVHLALLNTALPRRVSEPEDDPLFDDDWAAAETLYPQAGQSTDRPPITLLVITVGPNIIFDPSKDELAVADTVLAASFVMNPHKENAEDSAMQLLSIRMVDPPSRLTPPGLPDFLNPATTGGGADAVDSIQNQSVNGETLTDAERKSVWTLPRGGMKRSLLPKLVNCVIAKGGVGYEVMDGLATVET